MTPEWRESHRAAFEAWATDHVDFYPGRLRRYEGEPKLGTPNGEYLKITVQAMFEAWIAAKADKVEVTDEMVERGQCAWRNYPLPVSVGGVHALEELEATDREMMKAALSAALNPPPPQGTEAAK